MSKQNTNTVSKGVLHKNPSIGVLGSVEREFRTPSIRERILEIGNGYRLLESGGRRLLEAY